VKVLLVGSGGREHALAWKLAQAGSLTELHAAPGNPGIARLGSCHPVRPEDAEALLGLARSIAADLVVVGPEAPLVTGVADHLRHAGIRVFGPSASAARIEGSKRYAKDVMGAAGVPTARPLETARPPCVLKADGLAAGKGVAVCRTEAELAAGKEAISAAEGEVLIEELLEGPEVSLIAICDGVQALPLPPAQDFKRAYDGDEGPNTGGMGAYAPVPWLDDERVGDLVERIHLPVLAELSARGTPFVGALYAGIILTDEGAKVLEFNCRFGDPETQSHMPVLGPDLLDLLVAAAEGDLGDSTLDASEQTAVTVVLAAAGYPGRNDVGTPITGVEAAEAVGALVFHAGTALNAGRLLTNGGRIVSVTGVGDSIAGARAAAYAAAERIDFPGVRRRDDIARAAADAEAASSAAPGADRRPV
jgi:phosphoribosylamine---glycine ligase